MPDLATPGNYSDGRARSHRQLAADVPNALGDGDEAERRKHVYGGLQQLEVPERGAARE